MTVPVTTGIVGAAMLAVVLAAPARADDCPIEGRQKVVVRLDPPRGVHVAGAVITLRYPTDLLAVPGRERDLPAGTVTAVPAGILLASRDLDGELRLVVAKGEGDGLPEGVPLVTVEFGRCRGAPAKAIHLLCSVQDASDTKSTKVDGAECRAAPE